MRAQSHYHCQPLRHANFASSARRPTSSSAKCSAQRLRLLAVVTSFQFGSPSGMSKFAAPVAFPVQYLSFKLVTDPLDSFKAAVSVNFQCTTFLAHTVKTLSSYKVVRIDSFKIFWQLRCDAPRRASCPLSNAVTTQVHVQPVMRARFWQNSYSSFSLLLSYGVVRLR